MKTKLLFFAMIMLCLSSCQQEISMEDLSLGQFEKDKQLLESFGYDVSDIWEHEGGYVVNGYVWLTEERMDELRNQEELPEDEESVTRSIFNYGQKVNKQYQDKLKVLDNTAGSLGYSITNAMNEWNKVPQCQIGFGYGQQNDAVKITITEEALSGSTLMIIAEPKDGKPSATIKINKNCSFKPDQYSDQEKYMIMHALGHAIGLQHPSYASYDPKSIMTEEKNPLSWSGFSATDKFVLGSEYPADYDPGEVERPGQGSNPINIVLFRSKEMPYIVGDTVEFEARYKLKDGSYSEGGPEFNGIGIGCDILEKSWNKVKVRFTKPGYDYIYFTYYVETIPGAQWDIQYEKFYTIVFPNDVSLTKMAESDLSLYHNRYYPVYYLDQRANEDHQIQYEWIKSYGAPLFNEMKNGEGVEIGGATYGNHELKVRAHHHLKRWGTAYTHTTPWQTYSFTIYRDSSYGEEGPGPKEGDVEDEEEGASNEANNGDNEEDEETRSDDDDGGYDEWPPTTGANLLLNTREPAQTLLKRLMMN